MEVHKALLKWALLASLCTASALPESLTQSIFNDELFTQNDGEIGIFDISQNGRADVLTNLNLSPWELFVLNDLILKLTTKQCPKLNEDVLASFKEMLSKSFKQAPMVEIQNNDFLPSYSHLVRCLDHVYEKAGDATHHEKKKLDKQLKEKLEEETSNEGDWAARDAITSTTPAPKTKTSLSEQDALASTWMWGFKSVHQWLRELFKENPNVLAVQDKEDTEIVKQRQVESEREHQRRIDMTYRRARQNFANLFHEMSKIVRKSCPVNHRPDKVFMRKALLDMASWATLEERETIAAAAKYFRKHDLLKLLQECSNAL